MTDNHKLSDNEIIVASIKKQVEQTQHPQVLSGIGGFAAVYDFSGYKNAALVTSTDGVGTKTKLAQRSEHYHTIGVDAVAMCVNDIICHGAKPLFFLDYIAANQLKKETIEPIIAGIIDGCQQANCPLIGGESAQMPGVYLPTEYDVAGFTVGVVDKDKVIDGKKVANGDAIIGIASSGVHSNGMTLIRSIFAENFNQNFAGKKLLDILLTPTKIYVKTILELVDKFSINACAHITGGGLIENVPRLIPDKFCARIFKKNIPNLPIFDLIKAQGVTDDEMWSTFNMGVGFVLIVPKEQATSVIDVATKANERAFLIGEIVTEKNKIELV
ncbi:MAG: phosphoribosylformylglycinamidine cyclo-ligase [SAR324 cluster bacterium]|nr:phosphoribosylformylglycinamidine cyclo-ligase [SAR324 cluster bacterium]